jgi:hypothetical protein
MCRSSGIDAPFGSFRLGTLSASRAFNEAPTAIADIVLDAVTAT